jgi:hypothetical protein
LTRVDVFGDGAAAVKFTMPVAATVGATRDGAVGAATGCTVSFETGAAVYRSAGQTVEVYVVAMTPG